MNHTPGPWKVDSYGQVLTDPSSGCYETIAATPKAWIDNKIFNQDCNANALTMLHTWSAQAQANAHLIAAAPELLEALKGYNLIDYTLLISDALILNTDPRVAEILEKLSAAIQQVGPIATQAIAKAEGRE